MKFRYDWEFENFIKQDGMIYNDNIGQYIKETEYYRITVNKWNKRIFIDVLVNPINEELIDLIQAYQFVKYERGIDND